MGEEGVGGQFSAPFTLLLPIGAQSINTGNDAYAQVRMREAINDRSVSTRPFG